MSVYCLYYFWKLSKTWFWLKPVASCYLPTVTVLHLPFQFGYLLSLSVSLSLSFPLVAVVRTFKTTLNKSGENGHPCLIPVLRANAFSFTTEYDIAVGLSYIAFIRLMFVTFMLTFWQVFNHNCMLDFVKSFLLKLLKWSFFFLFFTLLMWNVILIDLKIPLHWFAGKNSCIFVIKLTVSWCTILLTYCWIRFAYNLLRFFCNYAPQWY